MTKSYSSIFQHDCVNDLHFAVFSPELLQHSQVISIALTPKRQHWLTTLDNDPRALIQFAEPHKRLGLYYEKLWGFFFEQDEQFELIAQNLVVRDKHRTIGEYDFLFYDRESQQHCHLEVAIKFYLFFNSIDSQKSDIHQYWFGPNSQDTLAKKFSHLTQKQSQLCKNPTANKLTKALGINNPQQLISLKGYLFSQNPTIDQPALFNTENLIHPYYYWKDFIDQETTDNYYVIPKGRWISNIHQQLETATELTIAAQMERSQSPVMVARCNTVENHYIETERAFICPDFWPYSLLKPYRALNCSI